jgi:hypothetical protein
MWFGRFYKVMIPEEFSRWQNHPWVGNFYKEMKYIKDN